MRVVTSEKKKKKKKKQANLPSPIRKVVFEGGHFHLC